MKLLPLFSDELHQQDCEIATVEIVDGMFPILVNVVFERKSLTIKTKNAEQWNRQLHFLSNAYIYAEKV